jgi:1,2-diacylglycerol 3-beta-galactosyltransferase
LEQQKKMEDKKRFLIFTSDAGFGHRSAAVSVSKALSELYGDDQINLVVNPILDSPSISLMKPIEKNYDKGIKNIPSLWRLGYEVSDSRQFSELMEGALTLFLQRNIGDFVKSFLPHAILLTNPMFNSPAGKVRQEQELKIPLFAVVTDFADVHSLWFAPGPDLFFIASDWAKVKALQNRVPLRKLNISGIPVSPKFASVDVDKAKLRQELGLNPELTTILFVSSIRVEHILENLHALDKLKYPFQVVVIAGGNDDLYQSLQEDHFDFPIIAKNYVDNVPDWMLVSDLLVTKAGGLILSEGLAAGLPILMVDYLPGQEESNVRYVTSHQAGAIVENVGEFATMIEFWLKNEQEQLKRTADSSRLIGHPEAAFTVAKTMWERVQKPSQ